MMHQARLIVFTSARLDHHAEASELAAQINARFADTPFEVCFKPVAGVAHLFDELERISDDMRPTVILLDLQKMSPPGGPTPLACEGEHLGLFVEVVVSFPEFQWMLWTDTSAERDRAERELRRIAAAPADSTALTALPSWHVVDEETLDRVRAALAEREEGFEPLFDPTGLRSSLRRSLARADQGNARAAAVASKPCDSRMRHVAAVVDDEMAFAYVNALAAYRTGYRVWLCRTAAQFRRRLGDGCRAQESGPGSPARFDMVISDYQLAFPEISTVFRLDDAGRGLQPAMTGTLVLISGDGRQAAKASHGWAHLGGLKVVSFTKPHGGLFHLIRDPGNSSSPNPLRTRFDAVNMAVAAAARPPRVAATEPTLHSASGKIGAIADRLLRRAEGILASGSRPVEVFVRAAVLAADAREMLGGLIPTLSFEAVDLMNQAEVNAELSFFGIARNLEAAARLKQVKADGRVIEQITGRIGHRCLPGWDWPTRSELDFRLQAAGHLRALYGRVEQIDAAEQTVRFYSAQQRKMNWLESGSSWTARYGWPAWPVAKFFALLRRGGAYYLDLVTCSGASVSSLTCATLVWVVIFAAIYCALGPWPLTLGVGRDELMHSAYSMLMVQPSDLAPHDALKGFWQYRVAMFCQLVIAYVHAGLLISLLYRRLSHRVP